MERNKLFHAISQKLWLFILFSVIGGGAAWFLGVYLKLPVYEAEATVYAMNRSNTASVQGGLIYQDLMAGRQFLQDYSAMIGTRKVTSRAIGELKNFTIDEDDLRNMVKINLQKDSSVMGIRIVSNNPLLAAAAANALSRAFAAQMRELTGSDIIGILDEAKTPELPVPQNTVKIILLGVLAGMAAVFAVIYLKVLFDTAIREAEDVETVLKLQVLGIIPEHGIRVNQETASKM